MEKAELEKQAAKLEKENLALKAQLANPAKKQFSGRKLLAGTFLSLSVVTLIIGSLLLWLNRTVIDPNRYIQTVGPVIEQPAVQKAITANISDRLFNEVNVEDQVEQFLPPNATLLAGPIAGQIKTQTTNLIANVVASRQFYNLWINTNKAAQKQFIKVAKSGRTSPTININDVYAFISNQLQDTKLAPLLNKQLPASVGNIQVANVPWLVQISRYAVLLNRWLWIFALSTLALAALAVAVARDRRHMVALVGVGWMVASVVSLALVRAGRQIVISKIATQDNKAAAGAVWKVLLHFLYIQLEVMFVAGLALALTCWFLGKTKPAVSLRTNAEVGLGTLRSRLIPSSAKIPAFKFMRTYRRLIEWLILAATILVLLALVPLMAMTIIVVLVIALVVLVIFEALVVPDVKKS